MASQDALDRNYPELGIEAREQLRNFEKLLKEWNRKVNLISRKEEQVLERHIIPSLFPLKFLDPPDEGLVVDVGTGGGLPGIPLAIAYPHLRFLLLDSTRKKLNAVEEMARELGLKNLETTHERAEKAHYEADLITGRAVTALPRFIAWGRRSLRKRLPEDGKDRGILYWTGGEKEDELKGIPGKLSVHRMSDHLEDPELASKMLVRISFP